MLSIIYIILILKIVNYVLSLDPFFEKGQRAEIFELIDFQIPEFNITIPEKEFNDLKSFGIVNNEESYSLELDKIFRDLNYNIKNYISYFETCNFTEEYPYIDRKKFQELNISDKGYPQLNIEEILNGFKLDIEYYPDFNNKKNKNKKELELKVLQSNENFDLLNLLIIIAKNTDFEDKSKYNNITTSLLKFKFVSITDNNINFDENSFNNYSEKLDISDEDYDKSIKQIYNDLNNIKKYLKRILYMLKQIKYSDEPIGISFKQKYSEMEIDNNGYANFNIEKIINGFNFKFENYIQFKINYKFTDLFFSVLQSNKDFDLLNILIDLSKNLDFESDKEMNELSRRLIYYKFISKSENNIYNFNFKFMNEFFKDNKKYNQDNNYDYINYDDNSEFIIFDSIYNEFENYVNKLLNNKIYDLLNSIKNCNFNENDIEFMKEKYPELKIGDDGFPKFLIFNILRQYKKFYNENLFSVDYKISKSNIELMVYQWNKDFRMINILQDITNIVDINDHNNINDVLKEKLLFIKFVHLDENNRYILDENSYISFLKYFKEPDEKQEEFKTKNATMIVNINGDNKKFKKVTFSIGGNFSRSFSKHQYNIKIRGGKNLYGLSQFKLRADDMDPSMLRSKLVSDIHNRLGLTSISANFASLYVNDEYMGLYILTDRYKLSWIEYFYGEKNTTSLYKCNDSLLTKKMSECVNENEDVIDDSGFKELIQKLDDAHSV